MTAENTPHPDLQRLLRWEESGGTWRVAARRHLGSDGAVRSDSAGDVARAGPAEEVTLSLLTCDGGEEMDVLTSAEPELLEHVRSAGPTAL
ncbi:hypothetical protein AB0K08_03975 [Citricoccus sp. NPDC055426]|uniref:hypothetical protein n=1 Tax=Citricoccus sp. NPDC055426 TaxID=3155536 RepID=UPI003449B508